MKNNYLLLLLMLSVSAVNAQVYDFNNITLQSNWFNPTEPTATAYNIKYNGIWGWSDGNGKEYAIVGAASGTYFIDVTNPSTPIQRDYVAGRRNNCIWREIKTYQNYCYMVSDDQSPNSLQIVDLSYLPDSVHIVYDDNTLFERAHTIWVDGNKLYAGITNGGSVGSSTMSVFDLTNPVSPTLIRKLNSDYTLSSGQVHDMYVRNDTVYASCAYDGLYIFKLTSGNTFQYINSITTYVDQGYNHSSALNDAGTHLYFTDEVPSGMDIKVADVTDLSNVSVVNNFHSNDLATPHNPFIKGNLLYMAYYQDGLQVYDISNPATPVLAGFFDTHYQNPVGTYPNPAYAGAWGAYPWLPSGNILVNDMQNGLFVLDASGITAVSSVKNNDFVIRPNPLHNGSNLIIECVKELNNASFTVSDPSGKVVAEQIVNGKTLSLQLPDLAGGLYIVSIVQDGFRMTRKISVVD